MQKFRTDDVRYPDLGSDASSVWNFCSRCSDVISREKPVMSSRNVGSFLYGEGGGEGVGGGLTLGIFSATFRYSIMDISKIQLVVYYQCSVLIG